MLNHYVFIRYAKGTSAEHIREFSRRMLALRTSIASIRHLSVGLDGLHDARSWDLLLIMRFESVEALREYQRHPEHVALMEFNQPHVTEVGSVDFFGDGMT